MIDTRKTAFLQGGLYMNNYAAYLIRSILVLTLLMFTAIPGHSSFLNLKGGTSRDVTGSISGWVESPDGNITDGRIQLLQDGYYFMEFWNLGPMGEFQFDNIPPGIYELIFLDFGELPVCDRIEVEVESNRVSNVVIHVPFTLTDMPCDEKLDMGLNGYYDFVYGLLEENSSQDMFLSEMGQDRVAQIYGDCKAESNDLLLENLPRTDRELVENLRTAIENYEWSYYAVMFFMGTGAGHFGTRTQPWREEFIEKVILDISYPPSVSDELLDESMDILYHLYSAIDDVGEPYWDEESEEFFYETLDAYSDSVDELNNAVTELPEGIIVMVGNYLEQYLDE